LQKQYILSVYNTLSGRFEEVTVDEVVYNTYRRTGWGIENNDRSFYDHEIQFSALIGNKDDAFENFSEFISSKDDPEKVVTKKLEGQALARAFDLLDDNEKKLIAALFFDGKTEREYAAESGIPQKTINDRKVRIFRKCKQFMNL